MHMAPLTLTFALLGFWLALGWAVQAIVRPQVDRLPSLLLAPLIGFSATLVPTFWLSLAGMHAAHFALPLTIVLALLTAAGWAVRRPGWRWADALPVAVVALAVLAVGVPTLAFGFDWVANANDDWANYNLGAIRLIEHGMLHRPDIDAMLAGKDYPGYFYFLTVGQDVRPGAELMLAWLGALTRQSPFLVFMPLILAFNGVMICAAAALALRGARSRLHWFLGLLLVSAAPLSLYAVQQQLIAQVIGIAFTCGMAALACVRMSEFADWRRLLLVMLVAAAYLLAYPEMVPFFGIAFLAFHAIHARDRAWGWNNAWRVVVIPVVIALLTGPYFVSALLYLANQFKESATQGRIGEISIFPYFILPSGTAMLWGFMPLGVFIQEPWLSIAIFAGLGLTVFTVTYAAFRARAGSVVSGMLVIFAVVAVQLAYKRNDFGLFKLAMFAQPFIWFALIGALKRRAVAVVASVALGGALITTDAAMVETSLRDGVGGGIGIAGASRSQVLHRTLGSFDDIGCDVSFETSNPPLIKILSAHPGCARLFQTRLTFKTFSAAGWVGLNPLHRIFGIDSFVKEATERLDPRLSELTFPGRDGSPVKLSIFDQGSMSTKRIGLGLRNENRLNFVEPEQVRVEDVDKLTNHVEFVSSSLGDDYYLPEFNTVGIYANEPDPFMAGDEFQAIGRYILLKVLHPSERIRLMLDISTTVMQGATRELPPAVVMGAETVSMGLIGDGSARVLSPPVAPLVTSRGAYLLIDLGRDAKPILRPRTGAMALYGTQSPVDYRSITAFARRIAAVDAADCHCDAAPSSITDIKAALIDPTLRYSGIYEDGWIGQDGFARLATSHPGKVEFRAMMPGGIGITEDEVTVSVEGGDSVTRHVVPGDIAVDVPVAAGPHRIAWHFATAGVLPGGDGRGAAASLKSIAIVEDPAAAPPSSVTDAKAALADPALHQSGVYADGWIAQDGFVRLGAAGPGKVEFRAMVPGGIGISDDALTLSIDGRDSVTRAVTPGDIALDVPVAAGPHRIAWHFASVGALPGGDGRSVAASLISVAIVQDVGDVGSPASPASVDR